MAKYLLDIEDRSAYASHVKKQCLIKSNLKYEEVYLCEYEPFEAVVARFPYFIEAACNQKRLHSTFGYGSPNNLEELVK